MSSYIPDLICITGADGVGKSRIARWLVERLTSQGCKAGLVWSRFQNFLSKPLLALTRLSGHNYYEKFNGVLFGFHNFEKLYGYRYLFALMQGIDVNIAALKDIRCAKHRFNMIVCERGPWDTLADVIADTGLENLFDGSLSRFYTAQIRNNAKVLMVKRSKENIIQSRPELIHDYKLERKLSIYERLAQINNWTIIENNDSIETTFETIENLLQLKTINC